MTNSLLAAGSQREHRAPISTRSPGVSQAAVVVNPSKLSAPGALERFHADIDAAFRLHGWLVPLWLPTTAEFRGAHEAQSAIEAQVDVVLVAGGDGTIRTVAQELAGTDTPMAVLPMGTGNLLARNLRIPRTDLNAAVRLACNGTDRRVDLGWLDLDRSGNGDAIECFAFLVMAGAGFDAATMAEADGSLKSSVGAAAYVVGGVRASRLPLVPTTVTVDGTVQLARESRGVTVGNCGSLPAGVTLLPDADPTDGVLDGVAFLQRSIRDWAGVLGAVIFRRGRHPMLPRYRGRVIEVFTETPQPVEVDGDVVGEARGVRFHVQQGAVVIRCPN